MIHRLSANRPSFHTVTFKTGLNVILAERSEDSTKKDTRNGVGKSTLIEIIDFCLGASVSKGKGKGLSIEPLKGWEFTLEITLAGNRVKVTRAIDNPNRFVIDGSTKGWIDQPDPDSNSGECIFKPDRWKALLGWALFDIPNLDESHKYKPSFRSLISYFIRSDVESYNDPFKHISHQQPWNMQLHVGFLLGLNWENASKWQVLKDRENGIKALKAAIKTGAIEGILGSIGDLETQLIQIENQTNASERALQTFKIHSQYESVQRDADRLTKSIHDLVNRNVVENRRLARYEESVKDEAPPSDTSLEELYEESGLVFRDTVKQTLEKARNFHHKIISNRRNFLEREIESIRETIKEAQLADQESNRRTR